MHSIERYGIVALLFLVVTVVAVLLWDGGSKKKEKLPLAVPTVRAVSAGEERAAPAPRPGIPSDEESTLTLSADARPGPLQRGTPLDPSGFERTSSAPFEPAVDGRAPEVALVDPVEAPAARPEAQGRPLSASAEKLASGVVPPSKSPATAVADAHGYVVRQGDTLSEIAQHELGSARRWKEILAINPGLDPSSLRVGKELRIPGAAPDRPAASDPNPSTSAQSEAKPSNATWKVGRGESLWKIAERTLGDGKRWREIAELNPAIDPDRLELGALLKLPARSSPSDRTPGSKAARSAPKQAAPLIVASASAPAKRPNRQGGKVK